MEEARLALIHSHYNFTTIEKKEKDEMKKKKIEN